MEAFLDEIKPLLVDLQSMMKLEGNIRDAQTAQEILERATTEYPNNLKVWIALTFFKEASGDLAGAKEMIFNAFNLVNTVDEKTELLKCACNYVQDPEELWLTVAEKEIVEGAILLLKNALECFPSSAKLWLALALLEPEIRNNWIKAAKLEADVDEKREILIEALSHLPNCEELWLLAAENECQNNDATSILQCALKFYLAEPSVSFWITYAYYAEGVDMKKEIFDKAFEKFPDSELLWTSALGMDITDDEAKAILEKALMNLPTCFEFWLALAKLQASYEETMQIFQRAKMNLPNDVRVIKSIENYEGLHRN